MGMVSGKAHVCKFVIGAVGVLKISEYRVLPYCGDLGQKIFQF